MPARWISGLKLIVITGFVAAASVALSQPAGESNGAPAKARSTSNARPSAGGRAIDLLPENAAAALVVRNPDQQLESFRHLLDTYAFDDTKAYQQLMADRELAQGRVVLMGLAAGAGTDAWGLIGAALGREVALGLRPRPDAQPAWILVSLLRDQGLVDRALSGLHAMVGLTQNGRPDPQRSRIVDGVRVFAIDEDFYQCRVDDALILTNDRDTLRAALRCAHKGEHSLSQRLHERSAGTQAPQSASAWAFVDLDQFRTRPDGTPQWPSTLNNPLGGLLFGGWYQTLRQADLAFAWATVSDRRLRVETSLRAEGDWPATHRGFTQKPDPQLVWDAHDLPRFLGQISVLRDWAALFAEREALLSLPAASDLVNFSTTLTTLFGGFDFTSDVLPAFSGPTRLVAAGQDFSEAQVLPVPRLPAFALVAPLKPAAIEGLQRRLFSSAQMALSLLNADMAQNRKPTYLIDIERYRNYRTLFTDFSQPAAGSGMRMDATGRAASSNRSAEPGDSKPASPTEAGMRYNFRPAMSVVEGQWIIASSRTLLHDIIDTLVRSKARGPQRPDDHQTWNLDIDGRAVAAILRENRRELVTDQMLDHNLSKQEAERKIDAIFEIAAFARRLRMQVEKTERGYHATADFLLMPSGE